MQTSIYRNGQMLQEDVDATFLGEIVRVRLMRHAVRMYEANKRQGTHDTKQRADLHYKRNKLFKQKGTGRARVKHASATQCRHGAVPKGPTPRDYSYAIPRRARREALKSALLSKLRDGEVTFVDSFGLEGPKTKAMADLLASVGRAERSCLIVTHERDENLLKSVRNIPRVATTLVDDLNAYDVLRFRGIVMTEAAFAKLKETAGAA
jgi:large subunit ribosomal protein L4